MHRSEAARLISTLSCIDCSNQTFLWEFHRAGRARRSSPQPAGRGSSVEVALVRGIEIGSLAAPGRAGVVREALCRGGAASGPAVARWRHGGWVGRRERNAEAMTCHDGRSRGRVARRFSPRHSGRAGGGVRMARRAAASIAGRQAAAVRTRDQVNRENGSGATVNPNTIINSNTCRYPFVFLFNFFITVRI